VKAYQQSQQLQQQPMSGGVAYLSERRNKKSTIDAGRLTVDALVDAYKHRAARYGRQNFYLGVEVVLRSSMTTSCSQPEIHTHHFYRLNILLQ